MMLGPHPNLVASTSAWSSPCVIGTTQDACHACLFTDLPVPRALLACRLRDDSRSSKRVLGHMEAENAYTRAVLADTAELQAGLAAEMRARMQEEDQGVPSRSGRACMAHTSVMRCCCGELLMWRDMAGASEAGFVRPAQQLPGMPPCMRQQIHAWCLMQALQ